jgi:hypothetical protein
MIRAEVRFTRDVAIAVAVDTDADVESLIYSLLAAGYEPVATVEQDEHHRLATARLAGSSGVVVDLMFASCGIEAEIVERAEIVELDDVGSMRVARPEELLAMKILSMTDRRLQDRLDARNSSPSIPTSISRPFATISRESPHEATSEARISQRSSRACSQRCATKATTTRSSTDPEVRRVGRDRHSRSAWTGVPGPDAPRKSIRPGSPR